MNDTAALAAGVDGGTAIALRARRTRGRALADRATVTDLSPRAARAIQRRDHLDDRGSNCTDSIAAPPQCGAACRSFPEGPCPFFPGEIHYAVWPWPL
jgi:hypothetical protein